MTLEFLKLADEKLAKEFNKKPEKDLMPGRRAKVIDGINRALASIDAGEDNPKRGLYTTREGVSRATLRIGSRKLAINGAEEFYVPRERLADFYKAASKSVEAGELDEAIKVILSATPKFRKTGVQDVPRITDRKPIAPELVHRRNVSRYGEERAAELLEANVKNKGWDKEAVLKAYSALPPL